MRTRTMTAGEERFLRTMIGVRTFWALALLIAPGRVLGDLPHRRIDRQARVFARLLGARHLVEAAITGRRQTRGWIVAGAAVDAAHAATMIALAALRPDRRALALTNAATATGLAAAGITEGIHA